MRATAALGGVAARGYRNYLTSLVALRLMSGRRPRPRRCTASPACLVNQHG